MATDRHRIKVSFTDEEMERVRKQADQFKLSISEMLRRFALGERLPDPSTFAGAEAIRNLLKVNADQARLGNLLKLALDESDGTWPPAMVARIDALRVEIGEVQAALSAAVKDIHYQIHPRAER
ncbi:conjugal transfer protein TraJ [Magnetospirillum sp. 15-1]|uniref:plasmid mobilization protein n=1 Tax=Magnetospirillum sp. 15-1 TaxID=1979370 RepID=UPI000BBC183E|nr:conjugal transfer protein TraJ [Magnetospirillum sp. 15-1]